MLHRIILSIGSNHHAHEQVSRARTLISRRFPLLSYSPAMQSEAIDMPFGTPHFVDQIAIGYTIMNQAEVLQCIKEIELLLGRPVREKRISGQIEVDIDLLCWDCHCVKPNDLKRSYVTEGLKKLGMDFRITPYYFFLFSTSGHKF